MIIGEKKGIRIGSIDIMLYKTPNAEGAPLQREDYRVGVEIRGKPKKIHIPKTLEVLSIKQVPYRSLLLGEGANSEADYFEAHWEGINEAVLYNVLCSVMDKKERQYVGKQGYIATPTSLILPPEVEDPFKSKDSFIKALPLWREEDFALLYEFYWAFSDKRIEIINKTRPLKRIRKLRIEPEYIQQINDILAIKRFIRARENESAELGDLERKALVALSEYDKSLAQELAAT